MTTRKVDKVFGEVDLWDFVDKESLKDYLGISDEDWDSYDIVFSCCKSGFAKVVGFESK